MCVKDAFEIFSISLFDFERKMTICREKNYFTRWRTKKKKTKLNVAHVAQYDCHFDMQMYVQILYIIYRTIKCD